MLKLNKASAFHLGGAKTDQTEQAHWLRRASVAKGAHRWRCWLTTSSVGGGGGAGASRSSGRTGNLDSQIPKESVSLCQARDILPGSVPKLMSLLTSCFLEGSST